MMRFVIQVFGGVVLLETARAMPAYSFWLDLLWFICLAVFTDLMAWARKFL